MGIFSWLFGKKKQVERPQVADPVVIKEEPKREEVQVKEEVQITEEPVKEEQVEKKEPVKKEQSKVKKPKKADVKKLDVETRRNDVMEIFETENGKKLVAVDLKEKKDAALTIANSYFRSKKDSLKCSYGYIKKDELYFEEVPGSTKVWLFSRKQKNDK